MRRQFCTKVFDWTRGADSIARKLFEVHTLAIDEGPRCDPRGMRPFELKKRLSVIPEFTGSLADVNLYHADIIKAWQVYYDDFMNGNVKLPGRDPAGPLTFHKINDAENVTMVYDKHGRVVH